MSAKDNKHDLVLCIHIDVEQLHNVQLKATKDQSFIISLSLEQGEEKKIGTP